MKYQSEFRVSQHRGPPDHGSPACQNSTRNRIGTGVAYPSNTDAGNRREIARMAFTVLLSFDAITVTVSSCSRIVTRKDSAKGPAVCPHYARRGLFHLPWTLKLDRIPRAGNTCLRNLWPATIQLRMIPWCGAKACVLSTMCSSQSIQVN